MEPVIVRGLSIGTGRPKIIVPVLGETLEQLLAEAEQVKSAPADLAEWRLDWYGDVEDAGKLLEAARDLGCNGFSVLRRVILPLSMPGVVSGITMVLVPSISTFYISQKLGNGKFFLIGDAIEGQYVANNLHFAAAVAFILMVILLVCMAVVKYVTNRYVYGGE